MQTDPRHQRNFRQLRAQERERPRTPFAGARRVRHGHDLSRVAGLFEHASGDRRAAFERLSSLLDSFVGRLGVGESFQAVDFLNHLDRTGQRPLGIDPRATGGAVKRLLNAGVIKQVGVRPNGGGPRHNSAQRPVYRVEKLPSEARAA